MSERDEDDDSDDPDYQPSDDLATQFGALSTANYSLSTDSTPSHAPQNLTSSLRGSLSITPPLRASDAYSRTRELMTPRGINTLFRHRLNYLALVLLMQPHSLHRDTGPAHQHNFLLPHPRHPVAPAR
jgi:hypothetical protein